MPKPVDEIFHDALALPPEQREEFLRSACEGDQHLLRRVRGLVEADGRDARFSLPPTDDLPKSIGRYPVVARLGAGGMGEVYKAVDPDLDGEIALKLLAPHLAGDSGSAERLKREAQLLATVRYHPNIATVHSIEQDGDRLFITMEFVEGESLETRIHHERLPLRTALETCLQIARALEAAHEKGVIHRDLKPGNVMIQPDGTVKVLDFGIAKALQSPGEGARGERGKLATARGVTSSTLAGTPGYMSPEQIRRERVDHRTDVWAFGRTLYECLRIGRSSPGNSTSVVAAGNDDAVRPGLHDLPSDLPSDVRHLIEQCLEEDIDLRLGSIAQARKILEKTLQRLSRPWILGSRRALWFAIAAVVPAVVLGWIGITGEEVLPPTSIALDGRFLVKALDSQDQPLWVRQMPQPVFPNLAGPKYGERARINPLLIIERSREAWGVPIATEPGDEVGALWMLSAEQGDTLWTRRPVWPMTANAGETARPHYHWQELVEWGGSTEEVLALGLRNSGWYGAAIEFVTLDNEYLASYFHPGHVFLEGQRDLNGDGQSSLLLFGDNSSARFFREFVPFETDAHCGFLALLGTPVKTGQAFPYDSLLAERRGWPEIAKAEEDVYLLIPPIGGSLDAGVVQVELSESAEGTKRIEARTEDGRVVTTDAQLYPLGCFVPGQSPGGRLLEAGEAIPLPFLRIEDGELEYVSVPIE